ncbi:MAG: PAS domain-containing protein [Chloroflexota bacterium]
MAEPTVSSDLHSLAQYAVNWPDAVLVFDGPQQQCLVVNDAAERLLGYSRQELLSMAPADLSHPDDAKVIPDMVALAQRDGSVRRPWRVVRKDGRLLDTEMTLTSCEVNGQPLSQGIFRAADGTVASPRQAGSHRDDQLKLLEQTGLTVVGLDRNGVVTYWNAAAEQVYGFEANEVLGRPVLDLAATAESRTEVESLLNQNMSRDEWVSKITIRPRHTSPLEAMVTGSIIRTADGEIDGYLLVTAALDPSVRPPTPRMRRAKVQCASCGREVAGTMRRKYCSEKCRQWAYYHRNLEAQRARSRERHERRRSDEADGATAETP